MRSQLKKLLLLAALLTPAAQASPVFIGPSSPYLQFADSPFYGLSFGYFYLEDFEDSMLNTPGVTASTGSPTGPGGLTDSVDADDGVIDGSGTNGHSFYGGGATGFTFSFDGTVLGSLPTHVGIVWTDGAILNEVTFEAFDASGTSLGTIVAPGIGDNNFYGGTAEDRFFGVIDPSGISAIHIYNSMMSGGGSGIEVDHLQYGGAVVPLPASLWLLASGLFALAGVSARKL